MLDENRPKLINRHNFPTKQGPKERIGLFMWSFLRRCNVAPIFSDGLFLLPFMLSALEGLHKSPKLNTIPKR